MTELLYEAYLEEKIREVKCCLICNKAIFKKKTYRIGNRYICEDCAKDLYNAMKDVERTIR